jgi:hypothetical protein
MVNDLIGHGASGRCGLWHGGPRPGRDGRRGGGRDPHADGGFGGARQLVGETSRSSEPCSTAPVYPAIPRPAGPHRGRRPRPGCADVGGVGGLKSSGIGREECVEELLSFTETKAVHLAYS